ncbi:MAG: hypothetical protein LBF15_02140 [Candidatus Peribacteria bacterium]|nr:hypothetical protein [Candidatus Peribacteria bacterium]
MRPNLSSTSSIKTSLSTKSPFSHIFINSSLSLSVSSLISQKTCSIISSIVTSPATQPYSSTTIAIVLYDFCKLSKSIEID